MFASFAADDCEVYEFAYALYLAGEVDRDVADFIAQAAGVIRVEQTAEASNYLTGSAPNL